MKKEQRVKKAFFTAVMLTMLTGGALGWLMLNGDGSVSASQFQDITNEQAPEAVPIFLIAQAAIECEPGEEVMCSQGEFGPVDICVASEDVQGEIDSGLATLGTCFPEEPTPTPTPRPGVTPTPTSTPTPETRQVDVIAPEGQESELGETVYYSFEIVNLGNVADRFQLELSSEHGFPTGDIPQEISLEAGERTSISTFVSLTYLEDDFPDFSELPSSDELTLSAVSLTDASVQDADTVLTELATPKSQVIFTKTTDKRVLVPGEQVLYTLSYRNTGNVPLMNVIVLDQLPKQLRFEESSIPPQSVDNDLLRFELQPVLMQGESGTFTILARVKQASELRGVIVNRAELSADGLPEPVEAQSRSSIEVPDLTIVKDSNRSSVEVGDIMLFTIRIANNGNGTARSAQVSDNLPTVLSYVEGSSVLNGDTIDDPQRRGNKEIVWDVDDLKAGDEIILRYQATVVSGAKSGRYKNSALLEARDSGGRELSAGPAKISFKVKRRGLKGLADIEGLVFWDKNENGLFDNDEVGLPDLDIVLVRESRRMLSDEDGEFFFPEVKSEDQAVSLDERSLPQGFRLTTDSTVLLHLGERDLGYVEFGVQTDWTELIGVVFHDLNGNGRYDNGEPGIEGVSLTSDEKLRVESDAGGRLRLSELPAGMHSIMIDESTIPDRFLLKGDVFFLHQLKAQSSSTIYFPLILRPGSITGNVFYDENDNGLQDEDEGGVSGIEILLQNGKKLNTTTDAVGHYEFSPLIPAAYTLRIAPEALPYNYQSATSLTNSLVLAAGQRVERSWGITQLAEIADLPEPIVSPTATETPTPTPTFTPTPEEEVCLYTVRSGDTLSTIAAKFTGASSNYVKIADFNDIAADAIQVDDELKLPKTLLLEEYQECQFAPTPVAAPEWAKLVGRVFFDKNRDNIFDEGDILVEQFHAKRDLSTRTQGKNGRFVFSRLAVESHLIEVVYGGQIYRETLDLHAGLNEHDFPLKYSRIKVTISVKE